MTGDYVVRVNGLPGAQVTLDVTGPGVFLRILLDQPLVFAFAVLAAASNFDPPTDWRVKPTTGCRVLELDIDDERR